MFGKFSYTVLMTVFAIITLLFVLIRYRRTILQYKKVLSMLFITWFVSSMIIDNYARKDGFWFNSAEKNSGIYVWNIPLEDVVSSALIGLLLPIVAIVISLNEKTK